MVTLRANRTDVSVGEEVTLSFDPPQLVTISPFRYTVDFGDRSTGIKPPNSDRVQHRYLSVGSYTISASLAIPSGAEIFVRMPAVQNKVTINVHNPTLSAMPRVAAVNEPVTFVLPFEARNTFLQLRVLLGDDSATGWAARPDFTHAYTRTGTFAAVGEVAMPNDGPPIPIGKTEPLSIQVADVVLAVPNDVGVGEQARFTVQFPGDDPQLRYRVYFGDNPQPSEWSADPGVTHAYSTVGTYQAYAELGRLLADAAGATPEPVATSVMAAVAVIQRARPEVPVGPTDAGEPGTDPPPPFDWLPYVVGLAVVALVGYGAKQLLTSPPPRLQLHRNAGAAQIELPGDSLSIEVEVRLHPGADEGQQDVIYD